MMNQPTDVLGKQLDSDGGPHFPPLKLPQASTAALMGVLENPAALPCAASESLLPIDNSV